LDKEKWDVDIESVGKQIKKLPPDIQIILYALLRDLENRGAQQPSWPNYSPLKKGKRIPSNSYHCHLKKGKPTYVACWRVVDKSNKLIEVFYVGTHENAPY
jgi:mRNA-degrading endonuclease RelE of RelBE toxin-antitoxin system